MSLHIFFATDGSIAARFAQAHLLALPWRPPVHVTAMTAMEIPHPPFTSLIPAARRAYDIALNTLRQDAEAGATEVLAATRRALEAHVASIGTRMHPGHAGPTIVDTALACRADLVVVGSRGLGPYKGFLLGSVSIHVALHARCPVLVVKSLPKGQRRFLVALEDSAEDGRVAGWLRSLDLSAGARIHLVKVPGYRKQSSVPDEFTAWGNSPEALEAVGCRGLPAEVVRVTAEVRYGHEVPEILDSIHEFRPELLILGATAWQSTDNSPLSKVTRNLIDEAPCSVLIVRP
jgi:nucleotide-binding universal stress UspA family protein